MQLVGLERYTVLLGSKLRMCEMVMVGYTIILDGKRHICFVLLFEPQDQHHYTQRKCRIVNTNFRPNGIVGPYAKKHLLY
jgi:hypothetical protein